MGGARPLCDGRVVGGDPEGVEAAEGGHGGQGPREQWDLHWQTVGASGEVHILCTGCYISLRILVRLTMVLTVPQCFPPNSALADGI